MSTLRNAVETAEVMTRKPSELRKESSDVRKATALERKTIAEQELQAADREIRDVDQVKRDWEARNRARANILSLIHQAQSRLANCEANVAQHEANFARHFEATLGEQFSGYPEIHFNSLVENALKEKWVCDRLPGYIATLEARLSDCLKGMRAFAKANGIDTIV
jgi:hypothetical protein